MSLCIIVLATAHQKTPSTLSVEATAKLSKVKLNFATTTVSTTKVLPSSIPGNAEVSVTANTILV